MTTQNPNPAVDAFLFAQPDTSAENGDCGGYAAILRYGERTREVSSATLCNVPVVLLLESLVLALGELTRPSDVFLHTDNAEIHEGLRRTTRLIEAEAKAAQGIEMLAPQRLLADPDRIRHPELWRQVEDLCRPHRIVSRLQSDTTDKRIHDRGTKLAADAIRSIASETGAEPFFLDGNLLRTAAPTRVTNGLVHHLSSRIGHCVPMIRDNVPCIRFRPMRTPFGAWYGNNLNEVLLAYDNDTGKLSLPAAA